MAKTSHQLEKEFIENLKDETGKTLDEWMKYVGKGRLIKRNDIINHLKTEYGFGHMNASLLAGIYFNGGKPVYGDPDELLAGIFKRKEQMKPLYDLLIQRVMEWNPEITVEIKKTYVSLQAKREFAGIGATAKEVRLAMDLDDNLPYNEYLTKTTGLGCMPRISHMVKLTDESQIDDQLFLHLEDALKRINGVR